MDKKSRDLVMGKLYLKNKDYKMAEKSFSEYLTSNPEDYQALKMLAQVQEHLNDVSKALDLYQRCYLSQPDRKGVLLDICRLLLINDPSLDHVDPKKWLKLAVQAFPTNPIVSKLKESLPNSLDTHPGRITTEDMILEKLTLLEDRFKNFEDKFESLVNRFDSFEDKLKNLDDRLSNEKLKSPPTKPVDARPPAPTNLANDLGSLKLDLNPQVPPAPTNPNNVFATQKSDSRPIKFEPQTIAFSTISTSSITSAPPVTSSPSVTSVKPAPSVPAAPSVASSVLTAPSILSAPIAQSVPLTLSTPSAPTNPINVFGKLKFDMQQPASINPINDFKLPTENSNNAFKFDGVNLFAESLKKFDLPTEGLWTKTVPKKDEPKENNDEEAGGDEDDGGVVATEELPIENTCDMRTIEIKTGEEDEDIVFKHRCKLFRFRDKEYKERGLGDIKVLKHRDTGKGRLIMRRELINLVCLNCWSCQNIERVRDTQVRFAGFDASDGDPDLTVFLVKFKTQELTDEFIKHLKDLFTED